MVLFLHVPFFCILFYCFFSLVFCARVAHSSQCSHVWFLAAISFLSSMVYVFMLYCSVFSCVSFLACLLCDFLLGGRLLLLLFFAGFLLDCFLFFYGLFFVLLFFLPVAKSPQSGQSTTRTCRRPEALLQDYSFGRIPFFVILCVLSPCREGCFTGESPETVWEGGPTLSHQSAS